MDEVRVEDEVEEEEYICISDPCLICCSILSPVVWRSPDAMVMMLRWCLAVDGNK